MTLASIDAGLVKSLSGSDRPVGKHFGNLESYPFHNQIHRLVLIESQSLVLTSGLILPPCPLRLSRGNVSC